MNIYIYYIYYILVGSSVKSMFGLVHLFVIIMFRNSSFGIYITSSVQHTHFSIKKECIICHDALIGFYLEWHCSKLLTAFKFHHFKSLPICIYLGAFSAR